MVEAKRTILLASHQGGRVPSVPTKTAVKISCVNSVVTVRGGTMK